jgi:tetratricopeptide (TPR) repeat protein
MSAALLAQPGRPPADPQVREARMLTNQGKLDDALAVYRQMLAKNAHSFEGNLGAGTVLDLEGKYTEARERLAKAIEIASPREMPQALRTMAISYAFTRDGKDAEKYEGQAYDQEIAAKDSFQAGEIADELGRILLESGDPADAARWYQKGHEAGLQIPDLKPADRDLWDYRWEHAEARIAARRGDHALAEKHVAAAKAILDKGTLNPQQATFFPYLTGYVAFYGGDYKTAIADLQKANQHDPFILSLLAQAYEKTGDKAQAMECYHRILDFHMHNPTNAFARPLAEEKLK